MKSFPYPLPSPPTHLGATCNVIKAWMYDVKGASEQQADSILAFMNENSLRSIPQAMDVFYANGLDGCRH